MANKNNTTAFSQSGMIYPVTFVAMLAVNSLVIYFANMMFPNQVVLGTMSMTSAWAIFHTASALAVVLTLVMPFMTELEKMKRTALNPIEAMVLYYLVNFVGLWLITRFSDQFGMGVTAWYIVAVMALVMDFIQGGVMVGMEKMGITK